MYCKNCGKQIPDGIAVCMYCGTVNVRRDAASPERKIMRPMPAQAGPAPAMESGMTQAGQEYGAGQGAANVGTANLESADPDAAQNGSGPQDVPDGRWNITAVCCLAAAAVFFCMGLYKMCFYDQTHMVNAYVGGDAYNYIINAGYVTACWVLSGALMVCAACCKIIDTLKNRGVK